MCPHTADDVTEDIKGGSEDVVRLLDTLLRSKDSDLRHLLQTTSYLAGRSHKAGFDEVWKRCLTAELLPGRGSIGVADHGPGVLLGLVVIAAKSQV